jgi:hypothetical protein
MPAFDTPGPISVTAELGVGDLRVTASDRADTVVEAQLSDPANASDVTAAEQTSVELADGVFQVKAPRGWKRYGLRGGGESIDVHIELPTGSKLRGGAGVAALRSTGTLGECHYKTGAGDITVEHVAGPAELTTGTGRVRAERIDGSATVNIANGDTWIDDAGGDLQVQAANAKIAVGQALGAVTAKTANGDIHLDEGARGAVIAETAHGRVDVAVRARVAAWVDLHTGFGQVHNLVDVGERRGPSEDSVQIRARSSLGDITVRRSGIGKGAA